MEIVIPNFMQNGTILSRREPCCFSICDVKLGHGQCAEIIFGLYINLYLYNIYRPIYRPYLYNWSMHMGWGCLAREFDGSNR